MTKLIEYKRGNTDDGAIIVHDSKKLFTAVTVATSKTFKTLRGADVYMTKLGYRIK